MQYLDFPLGSLSGGELVTIAMKGVESDVMLMSDSDARSFAPGARCSFKGGHCRQSPARIVVPNAGSWHVIVVPNGGRVEASVTVAK